MLYHNPVMPTIDDLVVKNQQFLCEFVDLKHNGWNHYSKALNNLTNGFWAPWLRQADKGVADFAHVLKTTIKQK